MFTAGVTRGILAANEFAACRFLPLPLGEVSLLCNDGEGLAVAFIFMQGSIAAGCFYTVLLLL